jgi:hypothetical protein
MNYKEVSWRTSGQVDERTSLSDKNFAISPFIIARSAATTQSPIVITINCHCEARSAEATFSIHPQEKKPPFWDGFLVFNGSLEVTDCLRRKLFHHELLYQAPVFHLPP